MESCPGPSVDPKLLGVQTEVIGVPNICSKSNRASCKREGSSLLARVNASTSQNVQIVNVPSVPLSPSCVLSTS